jgi:hypothetical protein
MDFLFYNKKENVAKEWLKLQLIKLFPLPEVSLIDSEIINQTVVSENENT